MKKNREKFALDYHKKNRRKKIRTVLQIVILLFLLFLIVHAVFDLDRYQEPDKTQWDNEDSFIALSYFGVGRSGNSRLIGKDQLKKHFEALYNQGYVTISQQDILDFYHKGKPLPRRALFLSFEDGRNDSSLFAQPYLERYNFKATMLTYANKLGTRDNKFLQPRDLLKMTKNGFWELGSNGYRLTYINIFDREGNYVGVRDEASFLNQNLAQYYNHYLMDFIRDHDMVPLEDRSQMEERITWDYEAMKRIYQKSLGDMPKVYMIMHANFLNHGMNRLVANINNENIEKHFKIHFNREGNSYNSSNEDIYDLTRLQPAPYWYTNHLLMKINQDTKVPMTFLVGDEKRAEKWQLISGAAEFTENIIALTSPPAQAGRLYLKNSHHYGDISLSTRLLGNVVGKQRVYLRADEHMNSFVSITIDNNQLIVEQKAPNQAKEIIYSEELGHLDLEYDPVFQGDAVNVVDQENPDREAQGRAYPVNMQGDYQLELQVIGDRLSVKVDQIELINNLSIDSKIKVGGIALEAAYSPLNEKDDIYDGVFEGLKVFAVKQGKEELLFTNDYQGLEGLINKIKGLVSSLIDWAIDTF